MSAILSAATRTWGGTPHILMTVDAVGGVWRYAMDLAAGLNRSGYAFTFVGLGPGPSPHQRAEAERLDRLLWLDAPLDWLAADAAELDGIARLLQAIAADAAIDLLHLNLPSQACGLELDIPVLVVSHSCVVTWFAGVRNSAVPPDWQWQLERNRAGFDAADSVVVPSQAHADMLRVSYGEIDGLTVVHNGSAVEFDRVPKDAVVFAAGRWWDDGKNGALLDAAAELSTWPVAMAGPMQGPKGQQLELVNALSLGELPHAEVLQWMSQAAVVASPSRYEPFGLAPLEAARAGAALVLSDIPTYRELWDGAALFAPVDDARAFAEATNRYAADAALRRDYARRARERAGRYTVERQVAAMQSVYQGLLRPRAAREA